MPAAAWLMTRQNRPMHSIGTGGGPAANRHARHILPVSARPHMLRVRTDTGWVVTLMKQFGFFWDRANQPFVSNVMSQSCPLFAIMLHCKATISAWVARAFPKPAFIRYCYFPPKALLYGCWSPTAYALFSFFPQHMAINVPDRLPFNLACFSVRPFGNRCWVAAAAFTILHMNIIAKPRFMR